MNYKHIIYIKANHLVLEEEYMVTQMLSELPIQSGHWSLLQNFISHWTKLWQDGETTTLRKRLSRCQLMCMVLATSWQGLGSIKTTYKAKNTWYINIHPAHINIANKHPEPGKSIDVGVPGHWATVVCYDDISGHLWQEELWRFGRDVGIILDYKFWWLYICNCHDHNITYNPLKNANPYQAIHRSINQ